MTIFEFDKLYESGERKEAPFKVIKTCGHCCDGCQWNVCDFWWFDKHGRSRCALFGDAVKNTSESLVICNNIYGSNYDGAV